MIIVLKGTKEMEKEALLKMQMYSKAYQDWLSHENDIYDEVFKDDKNNYYARKR
jgi:hypothetical protein